MFKLVDVATMRTIEAAADASGISYDTLMERAGRATAERIRLRLAGKNGANVVFLIGPGNNGGDGLVAGRVLAAESKFPVTVSFYLLKPRALDDPKYQLIHEAGLPVYLAEDDPGYGQLYQLVADADVLVDALYGIGLRLPLRDDVAQMLQVVHQGLKAPYQEMPLCQVQSPKQPQLPGKSASYVMAVDCPSGLDCDTGDADALTLPVDETVTYIAAKHGLLLGDGVILCGAITLADLGVPPSLPALDAVKLMIPDARWVKGVLPVRGVNTHKGSHGKALLVAGSQNYIGAAGLAVMAAYRSGVGLATVATQKPVIDALAGRFLEPTWINMSGVDDAALRALLLMDMLKGYDSLLVGPGLGQALSVGEMLEALLHEFSTLPVDLPVVIDADALNILAKSPNWWEQLPRNCVLTPHPAEMARLCGCDTADVQAARWALALEKAAAWGCVVLLKGAHTVIAGPDGQAAVLPFKTDALATAGTGDVLAGVIAGLLAQGLSAYDAGLVGGYLHGVAGELAEMNAGGGASVIASDLLDQFGAALDWVMRTV